VLARALFDERSEEFARAPLAGRAVRQRVGRAQAEAVRRTDLPAAPGGIDEATDAPLSCSRALVLWCSRYSFAFGQPRKRKPPLVARALGFPGARGPDRGYFFPFLAGFAFFAGAFFAAGFFGAAFLAAGFAGRGPGFAMADGLPSEATSAK
jgi:hypothetical protein